MLPRTIAVFCPLRLGTIPSLLSARRSFLVSHGLLGLENVGLLRVAYQRLQTWRAEEKKEIQIPPIPTSRQHVRQRSLSTRRELNSGTDLDQENPDADDRRENKGVACVCPHTGYGYVRGNCSQKNVQTISHECSVQATELRTKSSKGELCMLHHHL